MKLFNERKDCSGCMACVDMCPKRAITERYDKKGFLYPYIRRNLCVNCGLCSKLCAFKQTECESSYDKKCYAAKNKSDEIRMLSSSGGVYSALTDYVLSQHGVVYGAAYVSKDKIAHIRCESAEVRNKTRSAKYVQSDMRGVYTQIHEDLKNGRMVCFSGTPCQVASVARVFKQYRNNLLLIDLICHGVASPKIFSQHINYCEKKTGKVVNEFRFRTKIGDGRNQSPSIEYEDGTIDLKSKYIGFYSHLFLENKILRESCYNCPYSSELRPGDLTIGDYWGVKNHFPNFDDGNGVSAIIVNSELGQLYLQKILNALDVVPSTYNNIAKRNPNLKYPSVKPKYRTFWMKYGILGWDKIVDFNRVKGLLRHLRGYI